MTPLRGVTHPQALRAAIAANAYLATAVAAPLPDSIDHACRLHEAGALGAVEPPAETRGAERQQMGYTAERCNQENGYDSTTIIVRIEQVIHNEISRPRSA